MTRRDGRYRIVVADRSSLFQFLWVSAPDCAKGDALVEGSVRRVVAASATGTRGITHDFRLGRPAPISGTVIDEADKPVAGVLVAAQRSNDRNANGPSLGEPSTTQSAADGKFEFVDIGGGPVRLAADSPKHVLMTQSASAPADNVTLRLAAAGGSVEGTVLSRATGERVASATVTLSPTQQEMPLAGLAIAPREAKTNETGRFQFDRLPAGQFLLEARKGAMRSFPELGGSADATQLKLGDREATGGVDILLYPGFTLSGRVYDKRTSQPLAGARIEVAEFGSEDDGRPTVSAADGRYRLEGVFPSKRGMFTMGTGLRVSLEGYHLAESGPSEGYYLPGSGLSRGEERNLVHVSIDSRKPDVTADIPMLPEVALSGVVVDETGKPVADATVGRAPAAFGETAEAKPVKVAADGAFSILVPPKTEVRLRADSPRCGPAFSERIGISDTAVTGTRIVMRPAGAVEGVVVDSAGVPVADARVEASVQLSVDLGEVEVKMPVPVGTGQTASDGGFALVGLPAGDLLIGASKAPLLPGHDGATVVSGSTKGGVRIVLTKPHFIGGRVTDADGKPINDVAIVVDGPDGQSTTQHASTSADGRYRVDGLGSDRCVARAMHADWETSRVENAKTDRDDCDFVLKPATKLTLIGKVVDSATGQPVKDFTVAALNSSVKPERDATADGVFRIRDLRRDHAFRLAISSPGYLTLSTSYEQVKGDGPTVEKTYKISSGGGVTGRVVERGTKVPIAGVKINLTPFQQGYAGTGNVLARAETDAEGRFKLTGAMTGNCTLVFTPPAPFAPLTQDVPVELGKAVDMGDLELGRGATIKGRVVTMPGDQPLKDVTVKLSAISIRMEAPAPARTDARGEFEFFGLPAGTHMLQVAEKSVNARVSLSPDETREVTLRVGGRNAAGNGDAQRQAPARDGADDAGQLLPRDGQELERGRGRTVRSDRSRAGALAGERVRDGRWREVGRGSGDSRERDGGEDLRPADGPAGRARHRQGRTTRWRRGGHRAPKDLGRRGREPLRVVPSPVRPLDTERRRRRVRFRRHRAGDIRAARREGRRGHRRGPGRGGAQGGRLAGGGDEAQARGERAVGLDRDEHDDRRAGEGRVVLPVDGGGAFQPRGPTRGRWRDNDRESARGQVPRRGQLVGLLDERA